MGKRKPWDHEKGPQFERDMCRWLSRWLSRGASSNLLWRSSQSGGRATTLKKKGENLSVHAGDAAAIHPDAFKFVEAFFVECKNLESLRLDLLVYSHQGELGKWWDKCCRQAREWKKVPLMICREERKRAILVCTPKWLSFAPRPVAVFPGRNLCISYLNNLRVLDVEKFVQGGRVDASLYYG
jgi:hypothetical protein